MAVNLLRKSGSLSEATTTLASLYGLSKRQAYRYIKEAEFAGKQIPVPDQKTAFTVKLSEKLTQDIRHYARSKGQTISEVVTEALEVLLYKGRRSG